MTSSEPLADPSQLVALIAALVVDEGHAMPFPSVDAEALLDTADAHGMQPLLAAALASRPDVPGALQTTLRQGAVRSAALDLVREAELRQLMRRLAADGIASVVMKGAALAYTHYRHPELRPRLDTDLFIESASRAPCDRAFRALGYAEVEQVDADLVMYQTSYRKSRDGATVHAVDLHWRIANPQAFGDVLSFAELRAASVPVPKIDPSVFALSPVHAVLLACVHRIAHHHNADTLIWLYDIHLLASRLSDDEWRHLAQLAHNRGVSGICERSLLLASERFGTTLQAAAMACLASGATSSATARYLGDGRRHVQDVIADVRALATWRERFRLVRQHVLPSPRYMREVYGAGTRWPLPCLYAWRMTRGAVKWLTRV